MSQVQVTRDGRGFKYRGPQAAERVLSETHHGVSPRGVRFWVTPTRTSNGRVLVGQRADSHQYLWLGAAESRHWPAALEVICRQLADDRGR